MSLASTKLAANRNFSRFDFGELIDQLSEFYLAQHLVFEADDDNDFIGMAANRLD